jgi:Pilus formation protein N terminal region
MRLTSFAALLAAPLVAAFVTTASAGQPMTIESDQSQLVVLPSVPGSIVIGNPTIVDATVDGTKLFIHGRSFGTTNIMIMDNNGQMMGNFDVSVNHTTPNTLALYRGPLRVSYNCAPYCEWEFQIGDDPMYSAAIIEQTKTKIELATGAETAKSDAPPAPQ